MNERPLSPHLQVYRLPITALLSITHRIFGVVLSLGMVIWVVLLLSVVAGEESFVAAREVLASPVGRAGLWLWIYVFLFHLCHGVRHLLWDAGAGFARDHLVRNAALELVASVALLIAVLVSTLALA